MSDRKDDSWIQTYTGKQFWPMSCREEDIDIKDIAHALSLVNRYQGHTKFPFSVAQHCLLGLLIINRLIISDDKRNIDFDFNRDFKKAWMLHDASEAYICDLARPIKRFFPEYKNVEEDLQYCIETRYDCRLIDKESIKMLKRIDNTCLYFERRQLMATPSIPWKEHDTIDVSIIREPIIRDYGWKYNESEFLAECEILGIK